MCWRPIRRPRRCWFTRWRRAISTGAVDFPQLPGAGRTASHRDDCGVSVARGSGPPPRRGTVRRGFGDDVAGGSALRADCGNLPSVSLRDCVARRGVRQEMTRNPVGGAYPIACTESGEILSPFPGRPRDEAGGQGQSSAESLRRLRSAVCVAKKMGARLGIRAVLQ